MFCSHCGASIANDASFCHACGKPVPFITPESRTTPAASRVEPASPVATKPANSGEGLISRLLKPFAPSKQQRVIPVILAILLLGQYAMAFDIALTLGKPVAANDIGSFLLTGGLVFWYLWKCLERRGWIGALCGIAVSFLVLVLCSAFAGNVRGQRSDVLDQVPQFAALKENLPEVAEQLRTGLRAVSTDTTENHKRLLAVIRARVGSVVSAAMKTTSHAAIDQYANG